MANRGDPASASRGSEYGGEKLPPAPAFLESVIEALPDATMVIGRDYRVLYANRAARQVASLEDPVSGCLKCHQVSHHRDAPCDAAEALCPLREVVATKAPVTVVHTHLDSGGGELSVEITAAPIFDRSGEVVQIVETCRDVTERNRTRRLLEIANRHSEMQPLLKEFVAEFKRCIGCAAVGIRIVDADGTILYRESDGSSPEFCDSESLLSIKIHAGDDILGLVHLADPRANALSPGMIESMERAAMLLGTTIRRVVAEEALRRAHDELEANVQARTAQLAAANRVLEEEVAERNRLEREILWVEENQRQRIGGDLHDGLGQELTGLGYVAKSLHRALASKNLAEADVAATLASAIPQVLMEIRTIVKGLLPLGVGADSLVPALETLVAGMQERTDVSCLLACDCTQPLRDDHRAIQLYRIAQEALTNAIKHAKPGQVTVTLREEADRVVLEVFDDGAGIPADVARASGTGLRIMHHRARAIGAMLTVRRRTEGGTLVRCVLPKE